LCLVKNKFGKDLFYVVVIKELCSNFIKYQISLPSHIKIWLQYICKCVNVYMYILTGRYYCIIHSTQ